MFPSPSLSKTIRSCPSRYSATCSCRRSICSSVVPVAFIEARTMALGVMAATVSKPVKRCAPMARVWRTRARALCSPNSAIRSSSTAAASSFKPKLRMFDMLRMFSDANDVKLPNGRARSKVRTAVPIWLYVGIIAFVRSAAMISTGDKRAEGRPSSAAKSRTSLRVRLAKPLRWNQFSADPRSSGLSRLAPRNTSLSLASSPMSTVALEYPSTPSVTRSKKFITCFITGRPSYFSIPLRTFAAAPTAEPSVWYCLIAFSKMLLSVTPAASSLNLRFARPSSVRLEASRKKT